MDNFEIGKSLAVFGEAIFQIRRADRRGIGLMGATSSRSPS
jgi:hypothetical protein